MKNFLLRCIAVFLLMTLYLQADVSALTKANYLYLDTGSGYGSHRDEGSSPLRYHGFTLSSRSGYLSTDTKYRWGIYAEINNCMGLAAQNYLMNTLFASATAFYLWQIPKISSQNFALLCGPGMAGTLSLSVNEAYENATANTDIFADIFLRSRLQYAFQRPAWEKKIAFWYLQRPLRNYALAFHLDIPLLLVNNRPDFPYVAHGTQTDLEKFLLRHSFVGGLKLQSRLALTRYLPNGNALETAYVWGMVSSGKKDIYRLEHALHSLNFTFYFRLN